MSRRSMALPALLVVTCLFGCTDRDGTTRGPDTEFSDRPTTAEVRLPQIAYDATTDTVQRFAWPTRDGDLLLLDPDTEETTSVPLPGGLQARDTVSWSRSGASIAYRNLENVVTVYNLATGETRAGGTADMYLPRMFELSPDGGRLALVRHGKLVTVDGVAEAIFEGTPRCTTPGWSADSAFVAVGSMGQDESEDGGLWLAAKGGRAQLLVAPRETGWGATQNVMWSPDGKWVAWARGAGDGWTGDLARSDGSGVKRDTVGSGPLEWFPDSSGLLTTIPIEAGASATGIYRLKDYSLTQVGPQDWDSRANLSPGGEMVLAWGWDGEVLVVNTVTGKEARWPTRALILQADWARDGRIGAIVRAREGLAVWLGDASGEGEIIASAQTEVPEAARWIELPTDAAVLRN